MLVRWHQPALSLCIAFVILLIVLSYVSEYSSGGRRFTRLSKMLPLPDPGKRPFNQILIHIDLKGAPPKVSVYEWLFPLLKQLEVHGVVLEYEDMLPYSGELADISRTEHYTEGEILRINQLAYENDLELIPLIQTFGHMEFVLKVSRFASLRENPAFTDTICPSANESQALIKEMIHQVRLLHPNSSRIHIGADEAYHIAEDMRCRKVIAGIIDDKGVGEEKAPEIIKLMHLTRVVKMAKTEGFKEVFAWNDMFDKISVDLLRNYGLANSVTPVVWGYISDVTREGYFPNGLFERLHQTFDSIWFASAYKGANGISQTFIDVQRYLENHKSYVKLYQENQKYLSALKGIVMTGWQRYNHNAKLCELLIVAIPSLLTNIAFIKDIRAGTVKYEKIVRANLNCSSGFELTEPQQYKSFSYYPLQETTYSHCNFYGAQLYKLIMNDLRYLMFKAKRVTTDHDRQAIRKEMSTLMVEISREMQKYYYSKDIDEWIHQQSALIEEILTA